MDEQKKNNEIEEAASALIENSETEAEDFDDKQAQKQDSAEQSTGKEPEKEGKFFKKYKIKDIVFLAIMTACTLTTGAVMPFVIKIPLFGIVQLCLGLQFSIFPVIGMMKVRKPGALFLQSAFIAVVLSAMNPPMLMMALCGLVAEAIALLIFHGYKSDWACVVAGTLYLPLTLPFMYVYYKFFHTVTDTGANALEAFLMGANTGMVIGISCAVVAICFVGSLIGMVVSRELKKAGVLKK
mgnify:CR=1 FL=1